MGDQNNYTSLLYGDMLSRYGKQIVRYCYFRAKNYSEAMELIQEVEVAMWESLDTMRATTPRQTTSWVNSVMRNTISNHFRRKRLKTVPLEQAASLPLADDADLEQLHSLIAYLDPDEQRLLKQLFDGYSRAEIAAAEGLTVGAIHQRMHRIVNRLKEINKKINGN